VRVAADLGGPPEATLLGHPVRVGAPAAALGNGTLVHALDFDDTHAGGLVHATAMVLPATFAVGEQVDADGEQLLLAAVAGYEVACRLAAAVPHAFHARGLHATAICGVFAAATVAGRLMDLDEAACVNALGIAGSQAGGLLEFLATGASTKQLHPGFAGHAGVLAARLAAAGATGPASVLEGRHGLYAALLGRQVDPDEVTDGLGARWEVERITIKPYPACQLLHVTLDATAAAMAAGGWTPSDLSQLSAVTALVHPDSDAIVCRPWADKLTPRTPYDAKFSLPWSVAAMLVDGQVEVASYGDDSITRPQVRQVAAKVSVTVRDSGGVAADAPGHVELHLADGRVLTGTVPRSTGGPGRPLLDAALDGKFLANCEGATGATDVLRRVRALSQEQSARDLLAAVGNLTRGDETR
jgi:2-methylcitrate dehydratase PrpD